MERLQFSHWVYGKRTFAVRVPTIETLDDAVARYYVNGEAIVCIDFGVARVHPEDRYCKKMGRIVAHQNLKQVWFKVTGMIFKGNEVLFMLAGRGYELEIGVMRGKEVPFLRMVLSH